MRERTARLRDRLAGERDGGFTLTELLVSMTIFSTCMAIALTAVMIALEKSNDVQQSGDAASQLRLALSQIDRQVRSGNVLFSPSNEPAYVASCTTANANSGTCMRIFTQSNGPEKCVQWQIMADPAAPGTALLRTRSWSVAWQSNGDLTGWATVVDGLAIPSADPFVLEGASSPYKERLLNVSIEAWDARREKAVTIGSSLSGRNTTYGYDSNQCTPVPPE